MSLAPPRRALLLLPALAAGLLVVSAAIGPVSATETRYCAMGREMLASGDWVVPTLNGAPLLEKPPFEYWSTAAAMAVLGVNDWAPHVPHLLGGALVLLVVAAMARRLSPEGPQTDAARARGRLAALALGTMPSFVLQAYAVSLDIYLVLSVALAGWALLEADRATGKPPLRWALLLYAALGLGMLVKGPLTLALALGAAVVTALVRRDARILRPFASLRGIALFTAIALPWYLLLEQRMPGILGDLVRRRLFGGLASSADFHGRGWRPWVAWGPILGSFPWLAAIPGSIIALRASGQWKRGPGLPLALLALSAPVLFTFSKTALGSYAAPAYPFIALLVALGAPIAQGDEVPADEMPGGRRLRIDLSRAGRGMAVAAAAIACVGVCWAQFPVPLGWIAPVVVVALAIAMLWFVRRLPAVATGVSFALVAGCAAFFLATVGLIAAVIPERAGAAKGIWTAYEQHREPGEPVAVFLNYNGDFGILPWYSGGFVPFYGYESAPMIVRPEAHRPDLFRPESALLPWLQESGRRWLMLRPRDRVKLAKEGADLTVVASVSEYELVATVPPAPRDSR